jgi:hypothetical protein
MGCRIREIDWSTGEIMKSLRSMGCATLGDLYHDNGPWMTYVEP